MNIHEELRYITRYDEDDLIKNDLRLLVEWLCKDGGNYNKACAGSNIPASELFFASPLFCIVPKVLVCG